MTATAASPTATTAASADASPPAPDPGPERRGVIRYWAAAKAEAGTAEEPYRAHTLAEALDGARLLHADRPRFARVLGLCSFLVDGNPVGSRDHAQVDLAEGGTVEVLPPFAGG